MSKSFLHYDFCLGLKDKCGEILKKKKKKWKWRWGSCTTLIKYFVWYNRTCRQKCASSLTITLQHEDFQLSNHVDNGHVEGGVLILILWGISFIDSQIILHSPTLTLPANIFELQIYNTLWPVSAFLL